MKKIKILKLGASVVVSIGVGAIVSNLVKCTTPDEVKMIMKICIGAGSLVLASVASDAASKYVEEKIDETVDMVKDLIKEDVLNEIIIAEEEA